MTAMRRSPEPGATVVHDSAELDAALKTAPPGAKFALEAETYGTITTDQDVTLIAAAPRR